MTSGPAATNRYGPCEAQHVQHHTDNTAHTLGTLSAQSACLPKTNHASDCPHTRCASALCALATARVRPELPATCWLTPQAREIGMLHAEKRALESDKSRLKAKVKDMAAAIAAVQVRGLPVMPFPRCRCYNAAAVMPFL